MRQHSPPSQRRRFAQLCVAAAALLAGVLAAPPSASAAPVPASATTVSDINGFTAGDAAIRSVDLAGTWSFTPKGRAATSITVPGGGWYKQGFADVNEATYSRTVTVPDTGQPQSVWIEFGAVNHQATLSVDGQVAATQTTSFTQSNFDISAFAAPGTTHTISVNVKGRYALMHGSQTLVPDAAQWSEAIPPGRLPLGVPARVSGGVRQQHVRPYLRGQPDPQLRRVRDEHLRQFADGDADRHARL
ncbi:sugar-binding domain-containing protein [Streptomyces sp. NPDC058420]|uniref:sugar-binding domain-containing protein n=1 Tax=Streptomyces sp. NPDC058420 TaxID=3346489 RepID=UPI003660630F